MIFDKQTQTGISLEDYQYSYYDKSLEAQQEYLSRYSRLSTADRIKRGTSF